MSRVEPKTLPEALAEIARLHEMLRRQEAAIAAAREYVAQAPDRSKPPLARLVAALGPAQASTPKLGTPVTYPRGKFT